MSYCTLENLTSLIPMQELINLTNDETLARDVKEINTKQAENAICVKIGGTNFKGSLYLFLRYEFMISSA